MRTAPYGRERRAAIVAAWAAAYMLLPVAAVPADDPWRLGVLAVPVSLLAVLTGTADRCGSCRSRKLRRTERITAGSDAFSGWKVERTATTACLRCGTSETSVTADLLPAEAARTADEAAGR